MPTTVARLPYPYRNEAGVLAELLTGLSGQLNWAAAMHAARPWVEAVREHPAPFWAMESLLREYPISSAEGLALMRLAEAVHLSPTAVLERVKRLTRDGYITGYEAKLNPAKLGAGLLVFVEILLDRTVHDVMDTFKAAVQVRPEILEAHLVAGGFDYLLKTRVADMAAYREFIGSVIWTLPGVRETRTYAVMEEVKNRSRLPV